MTVNQEIDALTTMGLTPMEFLVVPRILALVLMVRCSASMLTWLGFWEGPSSGGYIEFRCLAILPANAQCAASPRLRLRADQGRRLWHSGRLAGCLRGMQCGRSGLCGCAAATSAVVTGIVWIIISDASLTVIYDILGL